jgi:hypothetical protein
LVESPAGESSAPCGLGSTGRVELHFGEIYQEHIEANHAEQPNEEDHGQRGEVKKMGQGRVRQHCPYESGIEKQKQQKISDLS